MRPTANTTLNGPNSRIGDQLARRVASGAISQKQAQRTAAQRQTLNNAYGSDWRQKVFGGQNVGALRKSASEGDLGSKNELGVLREKRQNLLGAAKGTLSPGKALPPKMGLKIPNQSGRRYLNG